MRWVKATRPGIGALVHLFLRIPGPNDKKMILVDRVRRSLIFKRIKSMESPDGCSSGHLPTSPAMGRAHVTPKNLLDEKKSTQAFE
jgi:hypothetical protein